MSRARPRRPMALDPVTLLAVLTSGLVALITGIMAYLGYRSYQATGNHRLMFVVIAFMTFMIRSLFVAYSVQTHTIPHDAIEFVSALFDLVIVLLLFVPFVMKTPR